LNAYQSLHRQLDGAMPKTKLVLSVEEFP